MSFIHPKYPTENIFKSDLLISQRIAALDAAHYSFHENTLELWKEILQNIGRTCDLSSLQVCLQKLTPDQKKILLTKSLKKFPFHSTVLESSFQNDGNNLMFSFKYAASSCTNMVMYDFDIYTPLKGVDPNEAEKSPMVLEQITELVSKEICLIKGVFSGIERFGNLGEETPFLSLTPKGFHVAFFIPELTGEWYKLTRGRGPFILNVGAEAEIIHKGLCAVFNKKFWNNLLSRPNQTFSFSTFTILYSSK